MNRLPVSVRTQMLELLLALGDLTAVLVADTYTYDPAHNFLDDITAGHRVATEVVTSVSVVDGEVFGTVPTFAAVSAGDTISCVWFYVDTGSESTSPLVARIDQHGDFRPIAIETNGDDIDLGWVNDRLFAAGSPTG